MPRRDTPPEGPVRFPLAARGVYESQHSVKGHHEFYAVDSHGEQVAVRLVKRGASPKQAIAELWAELDEMDRAPTHLQPTEL